MLNVQIIRITFSKKFANIGIGTRPSAFCNLILLLPQQLIILKVEIRTARLYACPKTQL